jgi:anthranilate synthase component 1
MNLFTQKTAFNADTYTPVGIFLNLRNHYTKIALLESNDYSRITESKSFIGFNAIAEIKVENGFLLIYIENILRQKTEITEKDLIASMISTAISQFKQIDKNLDFCGFFGAFGFEFSHYIEKQVKLVKSDEEFPDLQLFLFENVLVFDHFKNETYLLQTSFTKSFTKVIELLKLIQNNSKTAFYFESLGEEKSSIADSEFIDLVRIAKEECKKGNVFQLVFSKDFSQNYFGDDFEVYRSLRSLNPSPYLFYFDFESHRIFGSSPEAQLKIEKTIAEIHPIAGTVKKTGNEIEDNLAVDFLINDKKENAEHTMLVDLARNDLSKNCMNVRIEKFKEVQHFSHVIHLVSKITGKMEHNTESMDLFANTFPAGTLSGTPKPRALELIHKHEKTKRGFYGGAIGFISFSGEINTAIIIRSIFSKNNVLHYRAGAGVVLNSDEKSELQEVYNKIEVLRKSIKLAELSKEKLIR